MAEIEERDGAWWLLPAPDERTNRMTDANEGPFSTWREAEEHRPDFERISRKARLDELGDAPRRPPRDERTVGDER